ncbi:LacI family transcriptional regulator [Planococcus sp. CP5-4]|uniref:LacI family DNA-binding transcriptional regulator n=1 Tax=unclassified Planococcus (in: firmicutes) TaxID=2662419 RepID=UPI001C219F9B|nr:MULTISPECIES: LacI family DNA-binding transcriptional regulator [unclassified Planococcus (in: firmicutes)]MBU9674401.1 LacI family transcriptional regulator [Planococcus sp. CP5-4_YE]MBV0909011.1 LacI family transcriptional regulator [Planococcus sp. CP5-4_UN]MBW6065093.1 LacI family transcriptional regulator [Planococcus sp. CP5-4]
MVSTTEVAKHAGVSQTTVSRVLNRPEQVKKETYDKVMQALAELDYGNTSTENAQVVETPKHIAVLFSKDCAPDEFARLREFAESAQAYGYQLTAHALTGSESVEASKALVNGVAGVIGIGSLPVELKEYLNETSVFLQAEKTADEIKPFDRRKAAYLATSYLAEKGHQQIAWVGEDFPDAGESLQGYYEAMAHHQLKLRKKRVHSVESPSDFDAIAAELRSFKKPTSAFVVASYEDGLQLLNSLKSAGFKVPKDISLVAVGGAEESDNAELTAVKPPSTVQPSAQQAVDRLLQQIEGNEMKMQAVEDELQLDKGATVKKFKERQKHTA